MTVRKAIIRPSNSLIIVSGGGEMDVPAEQPIEPIAASPSCLLVACYPEVDGDTELTLGVAEEVDPGGAPVFVGWLDTPGQRIIVDTVDEKVIFDQTVSSTQTLIRIWLSHPRWPKRVIVGIE